MSSVRRGPFAQILPPNIFRGDDVCSQCMLAVAQAPDLALFGVYDGHGGDMVAHYTAKNFKSHLLKNELVSSNRADFAEKSQAAFELALMSIDAELRALPAVQTGQDHSGSTSVMTLISPGHIICANTGDSRAVLCRNGAAVALSQDHKPYDEEEKARIEAAGGTVKFNRVNGDLAVSRALGDFVYKRCDSMPAELQAVTAFPETMIERREAGDEFVVLACDGIWDVMSSEDVVAIVRDMLIHGRPNPEDTHDGMATDSTPDGEAIPDTPPRPWDLGAVCEALIDHCLALGSRDNMSVVIVLLQPNLKPKPEAEAAS